MINHKLNPSASDRKNVRRKITDQDLQFVFTMNTIKNIENVFRDIELKRRGRNMISLIAPNLNEAKYLPTFLKSLESQTHQDFQLIIIDGGSTDGSVQIAEGFGRARVVVDETRNIGYIRNVGSSFATGDILFHTSSDTYLEPTLLEKIAKFYEEYPNVVALAGRTFPLGTNVFAHLGYHIFDFLRYLFTLSPFPLHKFRPSGNFTTIKREVFEELGGFPEVPINEDGLFGQKMDDYVQKTGKRVVFHLGYYVGHNVKRFEKVGGIRTILFYIYVLGNLFPILKPLLRHIELRSGRTFKMRSDLKR